MKRKDNIENSSFYSRYFCSFTSNFKKSLITICHFKSRTGWLEKHGFAKGTGLS